MKCVVLNSIFPSIADQLFKYQIYYRSSSLWQQNLKQKMSNDTKMVFDRRVISMYKATIKTAHIM